MGPIPWTKEAVYHDGDAFFTAMIAAIERARHTVELESYIFENDSLGQAVVAALKAASVRGVQVRLLLDGVGCSQWSLGDTKELERAGIRVRFFHPLPWQNPDYSFFRYLRPRAILLGLFKLNRRDHRKVCLIDGKTGFLGGMNVSARQLRSVFGDEAQRDTSVEVEGDQLSVVTQAFNHAWYHYRGLRPSRKTGLARAVIRLNRNWRERQVHNLDLVRRILEARDRVWITTPYFVPDFAILRALRNAAKRGVDVKLLVPKDNKVWGLTMAAKAFYGVLLGAGVSIFEYYARFLHAKVFVADSSATVGSFNFNHRSLFRDLEVDVDLFFPESLRALEEQFAKDLAKSEKIELSAWKARPAFLTLVNDARAKLALLFKRWI